MRLPVDQVLNQRMKAPDMRSVNGIQLLNLIREAGPISRAALARLSRMSKPTVSEQVNRLIALHVVVELGQGEAAKTGGKKPTIVAFNSDAGRVAGVSIGPELTHVSTADLQGKIKHRVQLSTQPESGPRRLLDRIERALAALLRREKAQAASLGGIGVGVPGRVECRTGVVLESGNVFGWTNVAIGARLAGTFGCPVSVDNDVNFALLAELHSGAARDVSTAVLIRVDTGVGSAVAMDRRIHHGSHWAAGEIGHLVLNPESLKHVSPRGQLESVVGADQVASHVRSAARRSKTLRTLLKDHSYTAALFAAAQQLDPVAVPIADEITYHLSFAVAHLALAYDPDVVLLSGEIFSHLHDDIRNFLSRTIPWSPKVSSAELGDEAVLIGAINSALTSVYERMSRQLHAAGDAANTASAGA